jgi:Fe-S-cluster containining protein
MTHELWYGDGLSFECQKCGGCCGGFPGYVWLTDEEIGTIAAHFGMGREAFLKQYTRHEMGRHTFREVSNYDCIMLKGGRCGIYDIRPVQCRTFPFWDENLDSRHDWDHAAEHCPGMNRGARRSCDEIEGIRLSRAR